MALDKSNKSRERPDSKNMHVTPNFPMKSSGRSSPPLVPSYGSDETFITRLSCKVVCTKHTHHTSQLLHNLVSIKIEKKFYVPSEILSPKLLQLPCQEGRNSWKQRPGFYRDQKDVQNIQRRHRQTWLRLFARHENWALSSQI